MLYSYRSGIFFPKLKSFPATLDFHPPRVSGLWKSTRWSMKWKSKLSKDFSYCSWFPKSISPFPPERALQFLALYWSVRWCTQVCTSNSVPIWHIPVPRLGLGIVFCFNFIASSHYLPAGSRCTLLRWCLYVKRIVLPWVDKRIQC